MAPPKDNVASHEARKRGVSAACVSIVASDIYGAPMPFPDAVAVLRTFNLETALSSLAMVNAATSVLLESPKLRDETDGRRIAGLLRFLFAEREFERATNVARSQIGRLFVPISPQGCAAMTEACLRYCARKGGRNVSEPSTIPAFGHVLLTFQQYLLPSDLFSKDIDFAQLNERQFALLTCNYLGSNRVYAIGSRPTRFSMMFLHEPIQSEMLRRTGLTARQWFDEILGLDPVFFPALALGAFGASRGFNLDQPDNRTLMVNLPQFFGQLKPPIASIFREILNRSIVDLDEIDRLPAVCTWEEALYHFNYLRRKSLWTINRGGHLLLHPRFLIEKFLEGVIHVLTEAVVARAPHGWDSEVDRRVSRARSDYGYIFDDYCRTVLRTLFQSPTTSFAFGYMLDDGRERDGMVILPGVILLFEFVQRPISAADRGTGEMGRFLGHLKDNVIKLASVRDAILEGKPVAGRLFPTEKIIPIVVTSDTVPVSHLNAEVFVNGLIQAVGPGPVEAKSRALPVQTLGIEQIENLGRTKLAECGAIAIADFLTSRANDVLERFTASPTCGLAGGSVDLWKDFENTGERLTMTHSVLIFRPETLPTDWYLGWKPR